MLEKFIVNTLPILIAFESLAAGIILICFKKYGSGLYWTAAFLLNVAVIYYIPKEG